MILHHYGNDLAKPEEEEPKSNDSDKVPPLDPFGQVNELDILDWVLYSKKDLEGDNLILGKPHPLVNLVALIICILSFIHDLKAAYQLYNRNSKSNKEHIKVTLFTIFQMWPNKHQKYRCRQMNHLCHVINEITIQHKVFSFILVFKIDFRINLLELRSEPCVNLWKS